MMMIQDQAADQAAASLAATAVAPVRPADSSAAVIQAAAAAAAVAVSAAAAVQRGVTNVRRAHKHCLIWWEGITMRLRFGWTTLVLSFAIFSTLRILG